MRQVTCAACQAGVPMSEAFSVADQTLCLKCAEQFLQEHGRTHTPDQVTRLVDPTVCVHCGADSGSDEWPKIAELPACTTCELGFRYRPYPRWLKISFVVFMCVAVAAFVYNLRFFLAYLDLIHAQHAMEDQRIPEAVESYARAADRLPEMPELAVIPNIYKAQMLVADEKFDEAMTLIQKTRHFAPPGYRAVLNEIDLAAQLGIVFKQKDYDRFLDLSQQMEKMRPDEPQAVGGVASAFACKYAVTGDAKFRDDAMQQLERAKGMPGADAPEFQEYESRIRHRLETREIISRDEFLKRFPNGWKKEGGA